MMASRPAAIASHSQVVGSISKAPGNALDWCCCGEPCRSVGHWRPPRDPPTISRGARPTGAARFSELVLGGEAAAHRNTLDAHVIRQAIPIGRWGLAGDQRLKIAAAGRGDAKAVCGDEVARHLLLLIGNRVERHV